MKSILGGVVYNVLTISQISLSLSCVQLFTNANDSQTFKRKDNCHVYAKRWYETARQQDDAATRRLLITNINYLLLKNYQEAFLPND